MRELAERLIHLPGVVAVTLGESRGLMQPESESGFGLYYRDAIRAEDVRALGFDATVVDPGEWGRLADGGGQLTIADQGVDVFYRNVDFVQHWIDEAEAGRYDVDRVEGYLAGMVTYVLVGELSLADVLAGDLPRPEFPDALCKVAPGRWRGSAAISLAVAETAAAHYDVVSCSGQLAKAAIEVAQAALAERGEWALSEKGIIRRAELGGRVEGILAAPGDRPFELGRAVTAMRGALGIPAAA